jgi:hypothetical protein
LAEAVLNARKGFGINFGLPDVFLKFRRVKGGVESDGVDETEIGRQIADAAVVSRFERVGELVDK